MCDYALLGFRAQIPRNLMLPQYFLLFRVQVSKNRFTLTQISEEQENLNECG